MSESREELLARWRALLQLPAPVDEVEAEQRRKRADELRAQIDEAEKIAGRVEPPDPLEVYELQRVRSRVSNIKETVRLAGRDLRNWWN